MPGKDEAEQTIRTADDVARRALALFAIAFAAYERPPASTRLWLQKHRLDRELSAWEAEFIGCDEPDQSWIDAASWRTEALHILTWSLGLVPALALCEKADLDDIGISDEAVDSPKTFIAEARLRPLAELQDAHHQLYREHWGVRAGPTGRRLFGGGELDEDAHPAITYQRHYAINWIFSPDCDWDDVLTDT